VTPFGDSTLYGPFPMRGGRLFGAFAALFVAVLSASLALETQYLACDFRSGGTCTLDSVASVRSDAQFASADLRGARMESVFRGKGKGKGTEYGVVVLNVANREHRLLDVDPDRAREVVRHLELAMASRTEARETLAGRRWLLLVTAVTGLMMLSFLWTAVRRMGALKLTLGHDRSLRVERRIFGLPFSARALSLHGTTDVTLEWSDEPDFWKRRHEVPRRVGRIVLVKNDGRVPISEVYWPGKTLHFRAAAALRRALGFTPGPLESELHALESSRIVPAMAQTASGRFGLYWAAVCCGSLGGLAIFGVVGLSLGLLKMSDGLEPWMLLAGSGGGVGTGVALVYYLTRPRPPR